MPNLRDAARNYDIENETAAENSCIKAMNMVGKARSSLVTKRKMRLERIVARDDVKDLDKEIKELTELIMLLEECVQSSRDELCRMNPRKYAFLRR